MKGEGDLERSEERHEHASRCAQRAYISTDLPCPWRTTQKVLMPQSPGAGSTSSTRNDARERACRRSSPQLGFSQGLEGLQRAELSQGWRAGRQAGWLHIAPSAARKSPSRERRRAGWTDERLSAAPNRRGTPTLSSTARDLVRQSEGVGTPSQRPREGRLLSAVVLQALRCLVGGGLRSST